MKRYLAFLMSLMVLLTCACGRQSVDMPDKQPLAPPESEQVEQLTEDMQAKVLEDIRLWAEEHLEKKGEVVVELGDHSQTPEHLGYYALLGGVHLYDVVKAEVRPVDGTYPDTADLGAALLTVREGDVVQDIQIFYLTRGNAAQTATHQLSLEQLVQDFPEGRLCDLTWWKTDGLLHYLRMEFEMEGNGCIYEFSTVSGQWGVRQEETPGKESSALQLRLVPDVLEAVTGWQETNAAEHDRETYHLCFSADALRRMAQTNTLDQYLQDSWENRVVYDLATGKTALLEGTYTGVVDYGYFNLLYPAENARQWVYLVDDGHSFHAEKAESLAGKVAVLTTNAALQNGWVETVAADGSSLLMDMSLPMQKGALVYVKSQADGLCDVTVLAGEPPHPQGQLQADQLCAETESLLQAHEVILNDTPIYAAAGGETLLGNRTGVAAVELRNAMWWKAILPGGGEGFWINQNDLTWEWPLPDVDVPDAPAVPAPHGAVAEVKLPEDIEGSERVDLIVPLEGSIAALHSFTGKGQELLICDLAEKTLLSRQELPGHDGTNELILLDNDPYTLRYYDGQDYWQITLDDQWQQSREEFDLALYLSVMGDLMIHQKTDGSISVGRVVPSGLQANERMSYQLVRILNDHQLLYQAVDKSISSLSYYGVYDSDTGETRAVTTIGQSVIGSWGEVLLIARNDNGWRYEFATVSLADFTYTPLEIGHESAATGINGNYYGDTPYIQCDSERRRLLLISDRDGTRTAEVVSLDDGGIVYTLERPTAEDWRFYLAENNRLLVQMGTTDTLWIVEY